VFARIVFIIIRQPDSVRKLSTLLRCYGRPTAISLLLGISSWAHWMARRDRVAGPWCAPVGYSTSLQTMAAFVYLIPGRAMLFGLGQVRGAGHSDLRDPPGLCATDQTSGNTGSTGKKSRQATTSGSPRQ